MRRPALFLLLAVAPAFTRQIYDEDPVASMAIRETHWKQMQAYVSAVTEAARSDGLYPADYSSPGAFLRTIEPLRQVLRNRTGYPPPGFLAEAKARFEQFAQDAAATYYRCYVSVAPGMEAYGLYLVPRKARFPAPLVIAQHGGGGFPELATFQGGGNYKDMVRGAVAQGYVVFAPLHIFYPYKDRDHGSPIPEKVREQFDEQLRAAGTSLAAVEVAEISRALDALLERREVDRHRVAMIGLSYGGFYTMYTAAVEPRIQVAVASCSFREQPDAGRVKPGGRLIDLAPADVAALVCPRPLQVQSGVSDKLLPIDSARSAAARAARYYARLGVPERFEFQAFDGGHEFRGDLAWAFLNKHLTRRKTRP
jgi:dienelactone hydrolase